MFLKMDALGQLAYEDQVELAKLGSTVIQGGYLRTELIQANSIYAEHLNVDDLSAIAGKFSNLMAGNPDGARLEMEEKQGEPYLSLYDENELRVNLLKNRIDFYSDGEQQAFLWAFGENSGGFFRPSGVELVSANMVSFRAGSLEDYTYGDGDIAYMDISGRGSIIFNVAIDEGDSAWMSLKSLPGQNMFTLGGYDSGFWVNMEIWLTVSDIFIIDTDFDNWRGRTETFTVSTSSGNKTLRFVNGLYVQSA